MRKRSHAYVGRFRVGTSVRSKQTEKTYLRYLLDFQRPSHLR